MASDPFVYVFDDDDGARGSLEFLLDCAGIRVRGFASADAFLKASPPLEGACVVTDVRMPGTSGIELVEALKASSEEHTSELQSLMRLSYAVFCLTKNITYQHHHEQYTLMPHVSNKLHIHK